MADQRIAGPYGDIVQVVTPTLDNWAKQLYAEQKQRQMIQYQENKALDDAMRKEFANVRSVDSPEVVSLYNDYKTGKKREYFDKSLRKNPMEFNRIQQENNSKLQRLYEVINGSNEMKEMGKSLLQEKFKDPDGMAEDAGQRLGALMNTPFSQVRSHPQFGDLTNMDSYKDQGPNYDFGEALRKASGKTVDVLGKTIPIDGGLQTQTSVHQFGNSPAQVYGELLNTTAINKAGRSAGKLWDKIPVSQIQATVEKYKQIPQEKWERMGLPGPQDLGSFTDNKADNYAKYLAMNYAINTEPKEGKPIIRENKKAMLDYKFWQDKVMEGIKFGHQKQLKKEEQNSMDNWIVNYWNQRFTDAKSKEPVPLPGPRIPTLTYKMGYQLDPDQVMSEALKKNGVYADEVYVTGKNKILPVYYKKEKVYYEDGKLAGTEIVKDENGNPVVDESLSRPMELDQAYLSMGYRGQTKKDLGGTMSGVYQSDKKEANKPKRVIQNGHEYILNEKTGQYE